MRRFYGSDPELDIFHKLFIQKIVPEQPPFVRDYAGVFKGLCCLLILTMRLKIGRIMPTYFTNKKKKVRFREVK